MSRPRLAAVAALFYAWAVLLLGQPQAHADVTVTIAASRTTFMEGSTVTLSGRVAGAAPGSWVRLQRKVDGSWQTVKSKQVWATRTYAFAVSPSRGYRYFRVIKPRQLDQPYAASPVVKLTVRWTTSITASASPIERQYDRRYILPVSGTAPGARGEDMDIESRWPGEPWGDAERSTWWWDGAGGAFEAQLIGPAGREFRFVLPATELRLRAVSAPVVLNVPPFDMPMNSIVDVGEHVAGQAPAVLTFDATAGDEVTLAAENVAAGTLTAPSGAPVSTGPVNLGYRTEYTFIAAETGRYVFEIDASQTFLPLGFAVSTPKIVQPDAQGFARVDNAVPGQDVIVPVTGSGTRFVKLTREYSDPGVVVDESGTALAPWTSQRPSIYLIEGAGKRILFATEGWDGTDTEITQSTLDELTTQLGGPDTWLSGANLSDPVIVGFDVAEGEGFLDACYLCDLAGPNGELVSRRTASAGLSGAGRHRLIVDLPENTNKRVKVHPARQLATPIDGPRAEYEVQDGAYLTWLTFEGTAGEIVSMESLDDEGRLLYPWDADLIAPDGASVDPRMPMGIAQHHGYQLPMTGTYRLVFRGITPHGSIRMVSPLVVDWPANQDRVTLTVNEPGRLTLVRREITSDSHVRVSDFAFNDSGLRAYASLAVNGGPEGEAMAVTEGFYHDIYFGRSHTEHTFTLNSIVPISVTFTQTTD